MSNYISIKDDRFWDILFDEACVEGKQAERIQKELEKIALDEKEIIRKPFERAMERLEECFERYEDVEYYARLEESEETLDSEYAHGKKDGINEAIEIVKEECGINE